MKKTWFCATLVLTASLLPRVAPAQQMPHLVHKDGRHALMVDDKPFLILGAQINNSSSWAGTLPQVWPALADMHVNTVEAPVYWEQLEPEQGRFDYTNVDLLVNGAREHHLHLVLLWFGTWKNGQAHYVPEWVKLNPEKFPREINERGKILDVLSPHSDENLAADKAAFAALMHHVREIDSTQHTVLMIQVENESGAIGAVRDHGPAANRAFAGKVPSVLHAGAGTWTEIYGADADERFAAFATASYINEVAKAGKAEYPLPMYCNVWITYPVHALENRDHPSPGQEYPSGGPQQGNIAIWKAAAPSIDILAPDFYSDDRELFDSVVATYSRKDNPLFIPETGLGRQFGDYFFYALGHGAIGFSPFGVDYTNWTLSDDKIPASLSDNFRLIAPIADTVARLNFDGKVQTAVEEKGMARQSLHFAGVDALVSFGYPQHDGEAPPGTAQAEGRAMVAQLGPMDFLVTGFNASVSFVAPGPHAAASTSEQVEILLAEEGSYIDGQWRSARIWNGDQTDRGLNFKSGNKSVVRIRLHTIPLYAAGAIGNP